MGLIDKAVGLMSCTAKNKANRIKIKCQLKYFRSELIPKRQVEEVENSFLPVKSHFKN